MQKRIRAVFMRGGTSKALMFRQADLPAVRDEWAPIFLAAMGSPDPNGRQLDGMGGGVSSLSKVCVVGASSHPDADVDYTFAQIGIGDTAVDYAGNCGNMSSAVGPFAIEEGLVPRPGDGPVSIRIHNTNTRKIIVATFEVRDGQAVVEGDCAIDGVAGTGAPIRLDFVEPGGAKTGKTLPSARPVDLLTPAIGAPIEATLVDAANPCVFVRAGDLGLSGKELPDQLDADKALLQRLEAIRQAGSVAMGLTPDLAAAARMQSIPKVAMVAKAADAPTLSGRQLRPGEIDLLVRMISVGQPHKAVPITGGLCLAVACRIPGGIPESVLGSPETGAIRIGHPSGILLVDASIDRKDGSVTARHASVFRTARRLFQGEVLFR